MKDLVGVCVADSAEDPWIGQCALHRVVPLDQGVSKSGVVDLQWFDSSRVVLAQRILAEAEMQGGALLLARFGQKKGPVLEVERAEAQAAGDLVIWRLPAKPAGDHQMHHDVHAFFTLFTSQLVTSVQLSA